MTTCLDCKNCKIKFPINKSDPLRTSLTLYPKKINGEKVLYRSMICAKNQWVNKNGKQVSVPHSSQNLRTAKLGNSRYLNQVHYCSFFDDMEG